MAVVIERFFARRYLPLIFCFFIGAISASAMAPHNFWFAFIFGFGGLYLSLAHCGSWRVAALRGWLFGFGYFVFGLYWIGNALLVDGNPYVWVWPLAVCGLPALLAVFTAIAAGVSRRFFDLHAWHGYVGFSAVFTLLEWLRGHILTGFPWNLPGYTWADFLEIAQLASVESVYLLSFMSVLWLGVGGFILSSAAKRAKLVLTCVVICSFAGAFMFGAQRLSTPLLYNDALNIRIVQPNTLQEEKWQREKMYGHFETTLELSEHDASDIKGESDSLAKTIIIWPETALSPRFLSTPYVIDQIAAMLARYPNDAVLLAGALRNEGGAYYNSVIAIDKDARIFNTYNKTHLVPFGEYIPFQDLIPLKTITQFSGFKKGHGAEVFSVFDGLTYLPLICYEVLFPNVVARHHDPDFILTVTNDAWYGISPGPYQHYTKAQFRAIETGTPVIRAANTGISGVIDPYGKSTKAPTGLFVQSNASYLLPLKSPDNISKVKFIHIYFIILLTVISALGAYLRQNSYK